MSDRATFNDSEDGIDDDGARVLRGLEEALAHRDGRLDRSTYRLHTPLTIGLRQLRRQLEQSREAFAADFGLDADVLRGWEEGRIDLDATAQSLIKLILAEPDQVRRTLAAPAMAAE